MEKGLMITGVNHMSYIQYLAGFLLKLKLSSQILGGLSHGCKFLLMASSSVLLCVRTNQSPVFIFFSLLCVMIYFPLSCTKLGLLSVHNEVCPAKLSIAEERI